MDTPETPQPDQNMVSVDDAAGNDARRARETQIHNALEALDYGMPVEAVARITGLTIEEVQALARINLEVRL